jgi:ribosomal protein S18 acetylase RimI-like enzyme
MVKIRPADPDDAEHVVRIRIKGWRHAYAGIVSESVLNDLDSQLDQQVARTRARWSSPDPVPFSTLVAAAQDGPIGFATFGPYRLNGDPAGEVDHSAGEVLAIYVDPDHHGRGAGRALMDAAVADLQRALISEVRLWVLEENSPARRFYERYGFVADGERHHFRVHPPDGEPVDLPEVRYTLRW